MSNAKNTLELIRKLRQEEVLLQRMYKIPDNENFPEWAYCIEMYAADMSDWFTRALVAVCNSAICHRTTSFMLSRRVLNTLMQEDLNVKQCLRHGLKAENWTKFLQSAYRMGFLKLVQVGPKGKRVPSVYRIISPDFIAHWNDSFKDAIDHDQHQRNALDGQLEFTENSKIEAKSHSGGGNPKGNHGGNRNLNLKLNSNTESSTLKSAAASAQAPAGGLSKRDQEMKKDFEKYLKENPPISIDSIIRSSRTDSEKPSG